MILITFEQAQNDGILTIATTNHPESIDDAILNRPSRFDVKYDFKLPTSSLRKTYALKWMHKVTTNVNGGKRVPVIFDRDPEAMAEAIAEKTDGWSFAFLKELCV